MQALSGGAYAAVVDDCGALREDLREGGVVECLDVGRQRARGVFGLCGEQEAATIEQGAGLGGGFVELACNVNGGGAQ